MILKKEPNKLPAVGKGINRSAWAGFVLPVLTLLLLASMIMILPGSAGAEISVSVSGDGVTTSTVFTQEQLAAMDQVQAQYSTINTWPTKSMYVARGVRLAYLLEQAGITADAKLIKVKGTDGFSQIFTVQELLQDTRYFYPGLQENHEYYGYITGSAEGAQEVDAILALQSAESDDFDDMTGSDAPLLVMGQRWVSEQTNSAFLKYVSSIEVLTAEPDKWESPTTIPAGGDVAVGSQVTLSTSDMDGDSIYYTTDGSDPGYESTMYNWIKERWWRDRDDDLEEINHPIEINRSMTIKAVAIGFGKYDSDVVAFDYQVPTPPALTADNIDNVVYQQVELTFTDNVDWREAISDVTVNGSSIAGKYMMDAGTITINAEVFPAAGSYQIVVKADGYAEARVTQAITADIVLSNPTGGQKFSKGDTVSIEGTAEGMASLNVRVNDPGGSIIYGPEEIAVTDGIFETSFILSSSASTGVYTIVLNSSSLPVPITGTFQVEAQTGGGGPGGGITPPAGDMTLTITGDGVSNPRTFTLEELQAMDQCQQVYSVINTWPTKKWYVGEGVKLQNLLNLAGMKSSARTIKFTAEDGYSIKLTVRELLNDKRYYFPYLKEGGSDADGHIPGSSAGAENAETILALKSAGGTDEADYMNDRDALLLMMGQRAVTEQTGNLFVERVNKIEVLTSSPSTWDEPKASPGSGDVSPGTLVRLSNNNMDDDKIYYTTDGSTPTLDSSMYNPIASRWWSSRSDELDTINHPIEINRDTTIKAITIGPGKYNSDVVTFKYQVQGTASYTLSPRTGGTVNLDNEVSIEIPAGALTDSGEAEVSITKTANPPAAPAGFRFAGAVYEIRVNGENSYHFAGPVTLTIAVDPALASTNEPLSIYYYDEALRQWINLGGIVSGNTISVQVDHFTKFAVLTPTVEVKPPVVTFTDLAGHWAEENIYKLTALGAVNGYPDGSFRPDGSITRAEFAAILVKAFNLEIHKEAVFSDVSNHWSGNYVATAAANGIVTGYTDNRFGPDDFITREQMAVMIYRAVNLSGSSDSLVFADQARISEWAREAVAAAAEQKIMNGYPDNTFRPQERATRAEAVTMIVNALEK